MNILIDTHVLLWWLDDPKKLSSQAHQLIESLENNIFVSAAVVWEIIIKKSIGKLKAPDNLLEMLKDEGFISLPITELHAMRLEQLPPIHQDPFDRIQIAQALAEGFTMISKDEKILQYDLACLRA
ncbi:MAG: PIN domain nuclease of toxin-antitoxin system [Cyclobacteriaceae bacterium]|jgi:PIN domain nuclease of toxin-antitoxin system